MTPGARLSAAIEVLTTIEAERRSAAVALGGWGVRHLFAVPGARAAIAGLVYDALRRRSSSAWIMNSETPRAIALGMLKRERNLSAEGIAQLCDGSQYAPPALTAEEHKALDKG